MIKPIRLKEISRLREEIKSVMEHLNDKSRYQPTGAFNVSKPLDLKTARTKELFSMFRITR